jgi:hypothetical protein
MRQQSAPRVREVAVAPDEPLVGTDRYDYADCFEIRVGEADTRSPEQFARCAFEEVPWAVRRFVRIAQRTLLGFRLAPESSPEHVLGWRIRTSEPEVIQLEAASPLLRGVIVVRRVDRTCTSMSSYVLYKRAAPARVLWKLARPIHRRVARHLLERAAVVDGGSDRPAPSEPAS